MRTIAGCAAFENWRVNPAQIYSSIDRRRSHCQRHRETAPLTTTKTRWFFQYEKKRHSWSARTDHKNADHITHYVNILFYIALIMREGLLFFNIKQISLPYCTELSYYYSFFFELLLLLRAFHPRKEDTQSDQARASTESEGQTRLSPSWDVSTWALDQIPTTCVCGLKFDVSHALSCKEDASLHFATMKLETSPPTRWMKSALMSRSSRC